MTMKKSVLILFVVLCCFSFQGIAQNFNSVHLNQKLLNHPINSYFSEIQNGIILTKGGQWASIQSSEFKFDWSNIDLTYQHAKRNNKSFKWVLDLTSSMIPKWLVGLSQNEVEAHISSFINKICLRYARIEELILRNSDKESTQKIMSEISNCRNVKIQNQFINNQKQQILTNQKSNNQNRQNLQQVQQQISTNSGENEMSEINRNLKIQRLLQTSVVTANFNMGPVPGYSVSVTSSSTTTNGATIRSTSWDWGDGSPVNTTLSSSHIYALTGTYDITLTVRDSNGNTGTKKVSLTVPATANLPVASFKINATKEVVFFNAGASKSKYGMITSYKWDFGDGTIKNVTTSNYTYTYASSGTYNVTLTIADNHNAKGSTSNQIKIVANVAPECNATVTKIIGFAVFLDSTCTDSDGYIDTYSWGWNDSTANGNTKSISHIYDAQGDYNITLIAYDDNGAASVQKTLSVQVPTNLPVANFTASVTKMVVNFNATSSVSPLGSITQFKWNFGDDSSSRITTIPTTSYTYATVDTFNVTLEVTDTASLTDTVSLNVTPISNIAPTAGFNFSVSGRTVTLTSNSTDTDGTVSTYKWNFGDSDDNGTSAATVTHTYASSGNYTVTLTVVDNDESSSTSVTHQVVINDPPVANFTFTNNFLEVAFDATSSTDDNAVTSYSWTWGDLSAAGSGSTLNHTFSASGTYNVTLTVTDAVGLTNSISKNVTVTAFNAAPVANFTVTKTFLETAFDATSSTDDKGVVSYSWSWGDLSTTGSGSTLNHTFPSTGTYNVTLTVTDAEGLTNSISKNVTVTANAAPVANFTFTSTFLVVAFDATSSIDDNAVTSYSWTWGDSTAAGSGSTLNHTFGASGTYNVTLTVTDAQGLTNSMSKNVTVTANAPPVAAFTFNNNTFLTVSFNASTSTDDNGITSYSWNYGDSTTGTGSTPSKTYTAAGNYSVNLTVTDAQGLTNSITKVVGVIAPNAAPVANFTVNNTDLTVFVNASASTDDKGISLYTWNWNDSTPNTNGVTANHTYTVAGNYKVTLTVTDTEGLNTTISKSVGVTVPNLPPTAAFTFNTSGLTVSVDGKDSTDDNGINSYTWTWGDGASGDTGRVVSHIYSVSGTYLVTLNVTDAKGLWNATSKNVTVTKPNAAPVAAFNSTSNGLTLNVDGSASTDDVGVVSYTWSWGDSTTNTTGRTATHSYTLSGSYNVTLTVADGGNLKSSISKNITVANQAPTASFTPSISRLKITVDATGSTDDVGVTAYAWDWDDNTPITNITTKTTNHTYSAKGTYKIKLTVYDGQGLSGTTIQNTRIQ